MASTSSILPMPHPWAFSLTASLPIRAVETGHFGNFLASFSGNWLSSIDNVLRLLITNHLFGPVRQRCNKNTTDTASACPAYLLIQCFYITVEAGPVMSGAQRCYNQIPEICHSLITRLSYSSRAAVNCDWNAPGQPAHRKRPLSFLYSTSSSDTLGRFPLHASRRWSV